MDAFDFLDKEWINKQNLFAIEVLGKLQYKDDKWLWTFGRFRYCISDSSGNLFSYYQYLGNSCYLDRNIKCEDEKKELLSLFRFAVKKINNGSWIFDQREFDCIALYASFINSGYSNLVVYIPRNKKIVDSAERNYIDNLIFSLRKYRIDYVVGNLSKVKEKDVQLVVLVVDFITTKHRQENIVKNVLEKLKKQKPLITMVSLMKIYDQEDADKLSIDRVRATLEKLKKQKREMNMVKETYHEPFYNDEELIMLSLSGYGPDPEVFGF